ncbi:hypothetical protein KIW84_022960 [Lathyrus oleraceus]|uniref:DUF7745 domain-containing protein n=1 Tax=Pisum sativum TaxID=3888 RepID=A0A9D4YBR2_PEA|nr:hypothetical protein KIW84_022960 [Pisum sativum]
MGSESRNTLPLKFKLPIVDTLIALRSKITPCWYVKDHPPLTKLGEPLVPESVAEALHLPIEELGYSMENEPRDELLKDFILPGLGTENPTLLQRVKRAWTQIHRQGKKLGKRDCRAKNPYRQWVMQRAKKVKLPYSVDVLIPPPEPESEEKERGNNNHWFELAVKEKKALRDKSDLKIHDVKLSLRKASAKIEVEHRFKEEAIRVFYVTPQIWREKCHKVELATLSAEHWRYCFSALKNESLGCLKEKAQMNSLLDTYDGSINLLQPASALYRAKYDCLARFCNELT